jgi:hypothetical protein
MDRRRFLLQAGAVAGAAGLGAAGYRRWQEIPARVLAPGRQAGHFLRDGAAVPAPAERIETDVVILGSGIAGLTAAWRLAREGHTRFLMVTGPEWQGNAAGAADGALRYPTGGHYLPLPSMESTHVREILADLGVIQRDPYSPEPTYDERCVVHAPELRVLADGHWREEALPTDGPAAAEAARFFAQVAQWQQTRGRDGKRVFAVPIALASSDPAWTALDRQSFAAWLSTNGYRAPALLWYLGYCCRDDYGRGPAQISAWAGLHYFCARAGRARNAEPGAVLTWPQGLAALGDGLAIKAGVADAGGSLPARRRSGFAVQLRTVGQRVEALCLDPGPPARSFIVQARRAICAMPLYAANRVVAGLGALGFEAARDLPAYAPWLVSNFIMKAFPPERPGAPLAWDNLAMRNTGLGWVVSTHQDIRQSMPARSAFTAYEALSEQTPQAARAWLQSAAPGELLERAAADLELAYGWALAPCCERVEITLRGHGMASPAPGFLSNPGLRALREADGPILFAHADLSGYSVFEEAAWWGDQAARRAMA